MPQFNADNKGTPFVNTAESVASNAGLMYPKSKKQQKLSNLGATLFRTLKDAGLSTQQAQSWIAKNKIVKGKKSR